MRILRSLRTPDEQPFGGGEGAEQGEEVFVGSVEGQVVVVAGEGEQRFGRMDLDEERGVGIDTFLKEGLQVFRGEISGPSLMVRADPEVAVAVELDQDAGELPAQVVQMGK